MPLPLGVTLVVWTCISTLPSAAPVYCPVRVNVSALACGAGYALSPTRGCVVTGPGPLRNFVVAAINTSTVYISWSDPLAHADMIDSYEVVFTPATGSPEKFTLSRASFRGSIQV